MTKIPTLILSFLLFITNIAFAQDRGSLSGKVIDKSTQKPIPNANIVLDGTQKGAIADSSGLFRITGIELKTYNISITSIALPW